MAAAAVSVLINWLPSAELPSVVLDEAPGEVAHLAPRAMHPSRPARAPGPLPAADRGAAVMGSVEEQLPPPDPVVDPLQHAEQMRMQELTTRFEQAAGMLHVKRYEEAVVALHRVLELDPVLPEAHANMGYALLGLGRLEEAAGFFAGAIDLRADQANAYYGLGIARSEMGDLEGALGAMRSYLHVVDNGSNVGYVEDDDPTGLFIARARSAIWEWEAQMGRGAWGPTRGIPPGLTEEQVRRDGTGIGFMSMRKRGEPSQRVLEERQRSLEALGVGLE